jgi:hypothetical protein
MPTALPTHNNALRSQAQGTFRYVTTLTGQVLLSVEETMNINYLALTPITDYSPQTSRNQAIAPVAGVSVSAVDGRGAPAR